MRGSWLLVLQAAVGLAGLSACGVAVEPPAVTYRDAALIHAPSQQELAAHYCPQVVPNPFGIEGAASLLCGGFFGTPPNAKDLRFAVQADLRVENPNRYPMPLKELLVVVTTFPNTRQQKLGAACTVFCRPGETDCVVEPGPDACRSRVRDVKTLDDFAQASARFLVSSGVRALEGEAPSFRSPLAPAEAELPLAPVFTFGPEEMLANLKSVAEQAVDRLSAGTPDPFEIPFQLEGTLWVEVEGFGRLASPFGPVEGHWSVPKNPRFSGLEFPRR